MGKVTSFENRDNKEITKQPKEMRKGRKTSVNLAVKKYEMTLVEEVSFLKIFEF